MLLSRQCCGSLHYGVCVAHVSLLVERWKHTSQIEFLNALTLHLETAASSSGITSSNGLHRDGECDAYRYFEMIVVKFSERGCASW
jgi:hypothetical protein